MGDEGSPEGAARPLVGISPSAGELAAVVRVLPDLYFVLDRERRFVDFSPGRDAELYRPPAEFLGRVLADVLPPDVAAGIGDAIDRAHARDEVVTHDYALDMQGTREWFEVRLAPFDGGMTVALVRNVTERRRADEELRLQRERAVQAEKLEALGRVAGSIAHDFNNLLAVIAASCALAERRLATEHPAAAPLGEAQSALRHAADLTKQLLAFARRESVGMDELDVDAVLDGMDPILRGLACAPVSYVRSRSPVPLRIRASRVQLEQVLMNVVVNAVDAMPDGGELRVCAGVSPTGTEACLEIADTGVGMTPEVRARALEPFFSTKPEGKGTGLGLATVDGIVRASGGRVALTSAPSRGTTVSICWPLA